jgi:hypothetical protein
VELRLGGTEVGKNEVDPVGLELGARRHEMADETTASEEKSAAGWAAADSITA